MTTAILHPPALPTHELVITEPADLRGRRLPIGRAPVEIGREAPLAIDSETISRRHARVWLAGRTVWITDCGSTNGTWLGGSRITRPAPLAAGQRVLLGDVEAVLEVRAVTAGRPEDAGAPQVTDTTRYLCAASYEDETFARTVIDETLRHPCRAVAPSYGVDLPAVARHALAAQRLRRLRDLLLLVITVGAAGSAVAYRVARRGQVWPIRVEQLLTTRALQAAVLVLLLMWLVVAAHRFHVRVVILGRRMSAARFRPDKAPEARRTAIRRRLSRLAQGQDANVAVFHDRTPFVGSGHCRGTWSFAVDVAHQDRPPGHVHADDVLAYLAEEIASTGLPDLRLSERLYVSGLDVARSARLLPGRFAPPVTTVDPAYVRAVCRTPGSSARTYLAVEVLGWDGQLAVNVFIRVVRLPGSFFLEGATFVLPPLKAEYLALDHVRPGVVTGLLTSSAAAAVMTLPLLVAVPFRLIGSGYRAMAAYREERRTHAAIRAGALYDYGARASIREIAMDDRYRRFFMARDADMVGSVVHEAVFTGLRTLFDGYDIAPSG